MGEVGCHHRSRERQRRDQFVIIRVGAEEKAEIGRLAAGRSVSELIRFLIWKELYDAGN